MKLYATVSSERASKGQGGKYLHISLKDEEKQELLFLKVEPENRIYVSGCPQFLKVLKNKITLYLELQPEGNRFDGIKGEK